MEGFEEKEYERDKISLIEDRLAKSESEDSTWSMGYNVGKWAVRYLELLDKGEASDEQVDIVCRKYWTNSSVREYCIDRFMRNKQYDKALQALDESIVLDKNHYGLIAKYSEKKKEIYLVQGNMDAYLKQLWQLVLEDKAGDMTLYRELKSRYSREEWIIKREEVFDKLRTRSHLGDMVQLTQREGRHEMQEGFEKMGEKILTITDIKALVKPIAEKYNVDEIYLFGSYARDEADQSSDLDFLVFGGQNFKLTMIFSLAEELRLTLKKDVDVFEINEINQDSEFYKTIMKERLRVA